jgi:hypothetical protein
MTRLTEYGPEHEELIFPCDCMDGDYLRISWDDDPEFRWLWIEGHREIDKPLRRRIAAAVRLVCRRRSPHTEIVLSALTVRSLRAFLADRDLDSPYAPETTR